MDFPSIRDADIEGKTVVMRVDYNLPIDEEGRIMDHTRISTTMKTINYVVNNNGKLVLISHLGRPEGRKSKKLRMDKVARRLSKLLSKRVDKLDSCVGEKVRKHVEGMKPRDIVLLENVRFHDEEKEKDAGKRERFAKELASLGDIYVNEAFAVSHRDHASITGIPKYIPGYFGLSFLREIRMINDIVKKPERPYMAIMGGCKKEKILALERMVKKADKVLMGGVMGNTFLKAKGCEIGKSKYKEELISDAKRLLKKANSRIALPVDAMVENGMEAEPFPLEEVDETMKIMDIGPETVVRYKDLLRDAKTVVWAGPLGKFEKKPYEKGTLYVASFISGLDAKSLVGGGDTISAMQQLNMVERVSHVSTGGGAFVDFITKEHFPGIDAIMESCRTHGHFDIS